MQRLRRRGRIAAVVAALAFLGVLVLAGVFRAEIEAWYHLERLKRDPGCLTILAGEPEGSPERGACQRFIARGEGKIALLRCLSNQFRVFSQLSPFWGWTDYSFEFDARASTMTFSIGTGTGASSRFTRDYHEMYGKGPDARSFQAILGWLPALGPGEHVLPEDPKTTYEVSCDDADKVSVRVRKLTPPPGAPASTPPSPPSTGTSAG